MILYIFLVLPHPQPQHHLPLPSLHRVPHITSRRDSHTMRLRPLLPHTTTARRNGHDLLRNSLRQLRICPLLTRLQDPLDCRSPPLLDPQRHGDGHGLATAEDALLLTDFDEGRNAVDDGGEILDGRHGEGRALD